MVVAQIDQGGLSLPNRDYYLNTDEKSKDLLPSTARTFRKCSCSRAKPKRKPQPTPER